MSQNNENSWKSLTFGEKLKTFLSFLPYIGAIIVFILITYPTFIVDNKNKELELILKAVEQKDPIALEIICEKFPQYKNIIRQVQEVKHITNIKPVNSTAVDMQLTELMELNQEFIIQKNQTEDITKRRIIQININLINDKIERLNRLRTSQGF